jgi:hypothetical protein
MTATPKRKALDQAARYFLKLRISQAGIGLCCSRCHGSPFLEVEDTRLDVSYHERSSTSEIKAFCTAGHLVARIDVKSIELRYAAENKTGPKDALELDPRSPSDIEEGGPECQL